MKLIDSNTVNFYPEIITDYLSGELKSKNIIDWDYSLEQLSINKNQEYSSKIRTVVHQSFLKQYAGFELTEKEAANIDLFSKEATSTVTTGHQLMLLGGSMFFYTKIIDVIKLAKQLSTVENPVLPIFWLASEDHDYQEISSINLFGKKISCPGENKGPVGRIPKAHFVSFLQDINNILGEGEDFFRIKEIINKAFSLGENLSQITRLFVRELFKEEGLLILDADAKELKGLFTEILQKELFQKLTIKSSEKHISLLKSKYKIQVNPRDINLFFIENKLRKRIIKTNEGFTTPDKFLSWTNQEMQDLINCSPEKISPNVLLRPLYQELLLPNLAYVGGASEIAYWLELKPVFNAFKVNFPLPLVRNPYFVMSEKNAEWLDKNKISFQTLFKNIDNQVNELTKSLSSDLLSFQEDFEFLKEFFLRLKLKGVKINSQLEKVVIGEEKRANSALKNLEKRFVNAEKKNFEQELMKLKNIVNKLFPSGRPMERVDSFINFISKDYTSFSHQLEGAPSLFEQKIIFIISGKI